MLSDRECRTALAQDSARKLFDGNGLHLLVKPTGYKSWRLKYRFGGKEKQLVFGPYPEVSLREARSRREEALRSLRDGVDPGLRAKAVRNQRTKPEGEQNTFEAAARRWLDLRTPNWKPRHAASVQRSLERDVFPAMGAMRLTAIRPADIRDVISAVQQRGPIDTAHRQLWRISAIFDLAIVSEEADTNPATSLAAILRPIPKRKYPALLTIEEARAFLVEFEALPAQPPTLLASRLLALTAARPGVIRMAEAHEFSGLDGAAPAWRVPAEKMKLEREESEQEAFDFTMPLSRQAADTVRQAMAFAGRRKYLFPSVRHSHRPISDSALSVAYRRVLTFQGRHVPHSWRSTFATIMNERAADLDRPGDRAIIDLMLAHKPQGVEATYNRAAYMPRRRELAQAWADLLTEGLPSPSALLPEALRNS